MEAQIHGLNRHRVRTLAAPALSCLLSIGFETSDTSPTCLLNKGFETLGRRALRRHFHVKTRVDATPSARDIEFLRLLAMLFVQLTDFFRELAAPVGQDLEFFRRLSTLFVQLNEFFRIFVIFELKKGKKNQKKQKMKKVFSHFFPVKND